MARPCTENRLRWDGKPGHYEVYCLTLTDRAGGVGAWIRYTILAPDSNPPTPATCSLWFLTMDPAGGVTARRQMLPATELEASDQPFRLRLGPATLLDGRAEGQLEDARWSLRWEPGRAYRHVRPALHRPMGDTFVDGVSARVLRCGRDAGLATAVVGSIGGEEFRSTSPLRLLANRSRFGLTGWRFEAVADSRGVRLLGEVDAEQRTLAGVTYHDPDGRPAYCANTEIASMRLHVYRRVAAGRGWTFARTLIAPGRAHFEYGQRTPAPGVELVLR